MFGYVRPSRDRLNQEERDHFSAAYCGLCHTLQRRYGLAARMILNYDLTFLAILLDESLGCSQLCRKKCIIHPVQTRPCTEASPALDTAADYSVILTWWQLRDGVADHSFFGGLKYRLASCFLRRAYRKAKLYQPEFDAGTQAHLSQLSRLEQERCRSVDRCADTFAGLLAGAAGAVKDPVRKRVLEQMLYHLGRWIYLVDAADDLKKDLRSGDYNPLPLRYEVESGELTKTSRRELAGTMDRSVEMMAAAFELVDFGQWTEIIKSVVYEGLYAVGAAVLDGTFHRRSMREERNPTRKAGP